MEDEVVVLEPEHTARALKLDWAEEPVWVDEEIYDLVAECNWRGWTTVLSCQDNHGRVWICFAEPTHAAAFMSTIAIYTSESISEAIGAAAPMNYQQADGCVSNPEDWNVDAVVSMWNDRSVSLAVSVRFPRQHLLEVERIILGCLEVKEFLGLKVMWGLDRPL